MAADPIQTSRDIIGEVSKGHSGNFTVRFWDGSEWQPASGSPRFTLKLNHAGAVRAMFWPFNNVALGEAYIFDDFDIEGDIFAFTAG